MKEKCQYSACGKHFEKKRYNQKYCSEKCCTAAHREKLKKGRREKGEVDLQEWECASPACKKKINYDTAQRGKQKKYCCTKCRNFANAERRRQEKESVPERLCENDECGNFFIPRSTRHYFCCEECRIATRPRQYVRNPNISTVVDKIRGSFLDCVHYDQCLDAAAKQNMATLKCKGCKKYRKRGDSMFFFLTDTYEKQEVRHDFR